MPARIAALGRNKLDTDLLDFGSAEKVYVENDWYDGSHAGIVRSETHPGHSSINKQWNELDNLLKSNRKNILNNALKSCIKMEKLEPDWQYSPNGPNYKLCWKIL